MKTVGVVVGLLGEARCFGSRDAGCRVAVAGVGPEGAARAAEALLDEGVAALASWGWAGGLEPSLAPGTLVLPPWVLGAGSERYPTNDPWRARLAGRAGGVVSISDGALAQVPAPLASRAAKLDWFERTGAVAADMESGAVAAAALRAGVPFIAVRAILDAANTPLPAAALAAVSGGRVQLRRVVSALVRRPQDLPALLRLATGRRAATRALRAVHARAGPALAAFG